MKYILIITVILFNTISCKGKNIQEGIFKQGNTEVQSNSERVWMDTILDYSDSILIINTIKQYSSFKFPFFEDPTQLYDIDKKDLNYFILRAFFDSTKSKIIVWYGVMSHNAYLKGTSNSKNIKNRMCPNSGEIVYNLRVVIGYKYKNTWKLYHWVNRQVPCCSNIGIGLKALETYYYSDQFREDNVTTVIQSGDMKGKIVEIPYLYSIIEKKFWTESPIWQKDTVGANGAYPFEIETYYPGPLQMYCIDCASTIKR